ncbi:MAG: hypothetical protein PHV34_00270 [Verrucomicrobiae bacterium]|nr:hypothetical protein [Verrucomicrobiae bacterium]
MNKGSNFKFLLNGADIALPDGTYPIKSFSIQKTIEGKKFRLIGLAPGGHHKNLELIGGQPIRHRGGPPLVLRTYLDFEKDTAKIRVWLGGEGGEVYIPAVEENGRQRHPPKLSIRDNEGKNLHAGQLELNPNGSVKPYIWKLPSKFKGRFRLDIVGDFSPFECSGGIGDCYETPNP